MTKRILVLGGRSSDLGESEVMQDYVDFFIGEAKETIAYFAHFDDLSFVIEPSNFSIYDHRNNLELDQYDLVIFRGKIRANSELAYCVSRYCTIKSLRFFNDYTPYRPASKVSQAVTFYELGVRFTKTIYALNHGIFMKRVGETLSTPFILKDSFGSHGNDNYLLQTHEEAARILKNAEQKKFIAQEYFPNKCDYRVLCVGDKQLIIRRKASGESHLNNTSQGGSAELVDSAYFPYESLKQATLIAAHLSMSIAGVDLLYDEESNDFAFLEVNSQPQLNSGAFVKEKAEIVQSFMRDKLV